ncbi:MAG: 4Fe-4S binding protein [Desulfohalobiaceae bacterium]|nr:4Fe-4S binding protein [Desulfohalobiaceae bacterium]
MKKQKKLKEIRVNREWCKGCGICVHFCPKDVLELDQDDKSSVIRPDDCIVCGFCERLCPDLAISVIPEEQEQEEEQETS